MRRLSFLIIGLLLAWLGVQTAGNAETFAPYLLTDALLLGGVGSLVFALNCAGWQAPPIFRRRRGLLRTGWTLLLTGLTVALCGALGLALRWEGIAGLTAGAAWGLGILLQLAGAWWPGAASEYARPTLRWDKDAAGNFVALPVDETEERAAVRSRPLRPSLTVRSWTLWLLALLALAALLRFWNLQQLPPGCINQECATALRLQEPDRTMQAAWPADGLALDEHSAALLVRLTGSGLMGLRLASALWGWLTVLFLALALRRLAGPLPALLGAALLALSPWHLWAGRSSDPWIVTGCLSALVLWLGLEAQARGHVRWWLPWGVAAALPAAQTPVLWPGVMLWALMIAGSGLVQARAQAGRVGAAESWRWPLCGLVAAVCVALPFQPFTGAAMQQWTWSVPSVIDNLIAFGAALLRPETSAVGALVHSGLLDALSAALALAGIGALLRHIRQTPALLVLTGIAAFLGTAALLEQSVLPPASLLLVVLPLLLAPAAVALDRLLAAVTATWGPPLIRTSTLLASSALVLLLLTSRGALALLWNLDAVRTGGEAQVETDMARFIAGQLGEDSPQSVTFVAPRTVLDHPSLRLLAGAALTQERILALELGHTLPFARSPSGDVVYLLPLLDTQVLQLLRQLYPGGEATIELDATGERVVFNLYRVRQADLLQAQSLALEILPADGSQATGFTEPPILVTTLDFAWADSPLRGLPFAVTGYASLVVPESGNYVFAVESSGPESTFTLTLDDILLLDSSLGLTQQQMMTARGLHRLQLSYRSGNQPGNLRVTWQREGDPMQVLGAPLLHSPTLPDQGLLGDYFGNERFEGAVVAMHKDPVLTLDPGLPLPYSVRWTGALAAPRAGEYLIGIDAPASAQVTVNGQLLADNRKGQEAEQATSYNEGLIYLPIGWHSIEVRYALTNAGAAEGLRLLWQPPGGDASELGGSYLLPTYAPVSQLDTPLPPASPLVDPVLGNDRFALSRPSTVWQPSVRIPADNLPPLALERLWQAGGICGAETEQLNTPHGAAFSPDGTRLYVADTGNRRIQVFSADGLLLDTIESDLFQEPVAIAVRNDGVLFVLDALSQQVVQVTEGENPLSLSLQTSFYRPRGIAIDAAGNLIVADTGGARVVMLGPEGQETLQFGGQGSLLGRGQPVAVLAAPNALWAISAEDGRLWNLTSDGSVTAVKPTGTVDGPQLARLADGRLLATDPARASFVLLSAEGEPLSQFGYTGELQLPTGIAATATASGDVIAVVDTRSCSVSAWRLAQ